MQKLVLWLVLFIAGLLVGFIPQYLKAHRLTGQLTACDAQMQLAHVRQTAALTYVSATQLNYGLASGYAQQFFGDVQDLAASTSDNNLRGLLMDILSSRDKITTDLARGNSEVVGQLQPIVLKLLQAGQ